MAGPEEVEVGGSVLEERRPRLGLVPQERSELSRVQAGVWLATGG